jgi:hypothetical protein
MSERATYDDVNLLLRLYELRREDKMRQAREWFAGVFKAPKTMEEFMQQAKPGSGPNAWYRMVTSYWEMVASFITAGVLNKELFFQSGGEMLLVWVKVRALVPEFRAARNNPGAYRNLETVAKEYIDYMNRDDAQAFETFAKLFS